MKKIICSVMILVVLCTFSLAAFAAFAETPPASLGGASIRGTVNITGDGAVASTSSSLAPGSPINVKASLTYKLADGSAEEWLTLNSSNMGNTSTSASATNPDKIKWRSYSASSSHSATYNYSSSWSDSLFVQY